MKRLSLIIPMVTLVLIMFAVGCSSGSSETELADKKVTPRVPADTPVPTGTLVPADTPVPPGTLVPADTPVPPGTPGPSVVAELDVTAQALIELYELNPIAADAQYKGRIANIEGIISSIALAGEYINVKLTGEGSSSVHLVCKVSDSDSVLGLQSGQTIDVVGTITGVTGFVDIVVDDCSVLDSPTVQSSAYKLPKTQEDAIEVSAYRLVEDYESNPIAADTKYKHQLANIRGPISSIALAGEYVDVKLKGRGDSMAEVVCKVSDKNSVIPLRPDESIIVIGTIAGVTGLRDIVVNNCSIPSHSPAQLANLKGRDFYDRGELDLAEAEFHKAIDLDPYYAEPFFMLGGINYRMGNRDIQLGLAAYFDIAIQNFDKAIQLDPDYAMAYKLRGLVYHRLGKIREDKDQFQLAIEAYAKAIELDPDDAKTYNNLGIIYSDLGLLQLAIQNSDKAIELAPDDAKTYNNRGNYYRKLGRDVEANADEAKACSLDSKYC